MLIGFGVGITVCLAYALSGAVALMGLMALVFMVGGWLFSSLSVRVDQTLLQWHFGPGFWNKQIPVSEIVSAERVRNSWTYGWGIRYTPHGWLYNIEGLDAVEILRSCGKRVRIGTDEPDALVQALEMAHSEQA